MKNISKYIKANTQKSKVTLTIDKEILDKAKEYKINISLLLEDTLRDIIKHIEKQNKQTKTHETETQIQNESFQKSRFS